MKHTTEWWLEDDPADPPNADTMLVVFIAVVALVWFAAGIAVGWAFT